MPMSSRIDKMGTKRAVKKLGKMYLLSEVRLITRTCLWANRKRLSPSGSLRGLRCPTPRQRAFEPHLVLPTTLAIR
jgi:hypothetical protein